MKRQKQRDKIKVLENEYQWYIENDYRDIDDIHGSGYTVGEPVFNRVGTYQRGKDFWEEFYNPRTGKFFSVRSKSIESSFRYHLSLMGDDLPNPDILKRLQDVERLGYKLPRDLRKKMSLAEQRDYLHNSFREALLSSFKWRKKYKAEHGDPHEQV